MPDQAALARLIRFVDVWVRERLPNEHGNCAIDSGCSHGAYERENFERLEEEITLAGAAVEQAAPECAGPAPACQYCGYTMGHNRVCISVELAAAREAILIAAERFPGWYKPWLDLPAVVEALRQPPAHDGKSL